VLGFGVVPTVDTADLVWYVALELDFEADDDGRVGWDEEEAAGERVVLLVELAPEVFAMLCFVFVFESPFSFLDDFG
jgi:hypothetical protein